MTESEMLTKLDLEKTNPMHPAWKAFVIKMKDRQYGYEPLSSAWAFYSQGWEACEASISNNIISLFTRDEL